MVDIAITGYNYSHGLLTNIHIMFGKNPEEKNVKSNILCSNRWLSSG